MQNALKRLLTSILIKKYPSIRWIEVRTYKNYIFSPPKTEYTIEVAMVYSDMIKMDTEKMKKDILEISNYIIDKSREEVEKVVFVDFF